MTTHRDERSEEAHMSDELGFRFTWYGHSCIRLETPDGTTVLFDPWFGNPRSPMSADEVERCDVMLVSHGHFDHLGAEIGSMSSADAVTIAQRTGPTWPAIHELSLWLGGLEDLEAEVIGMNKGGTVSARGLRMSMVHADHSAGDWVAGERVPLYLGEPVGWVVELAAGSRLYFAGDTALHGDMRFVNELYRPDVAFLPIGGHFTMDPAAAARAVELLGVRTVVPIHYGTFPILTGTPDALRDELTGLGLGDVSVRSPEPGELVS